MPINVDQLIEALREKGYRGPTDDPVTPAKGTVVVSRASEYTYDIHIRYDDGRISSSLETQPGRRIMVIDAVPRSQYEFTNDDLYRWAGDNAIVFDNDFRERIPPPDWVTGEKKTPAELERERELARERARERERLDRERREREARERREREERERRERERGK